MSEIKAYKPLFKRHTQHDVMSYCCERQRKVEKNKGKREYKLFWINMMLKASPEMKSDGRID